MGRPVLAGVAMSTGDEYAWGDGLVAEQPFDFGIFGRTLQESVVACFNKDAEKAYQCPAGKYCCGNGLPSDGSKDWQKCCVSPLQGGIKLELWPTVGVCLVVMVMLAGAVVLYMEASRRRSLQKSKEMPAESCEKGKGHGLQVEVKQSAEEPAHKEHMPRRKEQLPMQKPLKVMVVSPMRDPHRGPQAVGTPVASHLQSPSKALRMKLFGTPKSAPSSSSGSSFGWPGHQGDGISTPRVISAGQEAAIPDSPAIPGDLDRMNLTVSFGRSTIYRYPESPGQAGWMPRRDASSYFSTPVRMQRTFVTDFRELSSPETSASVSREERASRIDGDDSLPRFTLERNRQQGQQRSPPESPVTTNDGAHIASPQQLTPYHGRSFRPSLLGIGAIVRESVQSTERQAMVEVDANRPRDAAPGEACGNSTGGSGSLGKENCNE